MRWQLKHFPADGNLPANKRREKARSAIDWKSAETHPNLANKHDSMSFNFLQYSISHSIPHLPTLFHIPWHINYIGLSQIYRTEQSREFKCNHNSIKNFLHISVLSIHSYYSSIGSSFRESWGRKKYMICLSITGGSDRGDTRLYIMSKKLVCWRIQKESYYHSKLREERTRPQLQEMAMAWLWLKWEEISTGLKCSFI